MENDRLNEIRELNPDYDISMHKLNVCVGDSQYRLVYCIYVEHKESGISVYRGHRIEDLWLEKATLDIETGNVKILVGS